MKLVFLDIDGVLNDFERSWGAVPDYNPEFVPRCVQNFNRIIRATEARIVLSSSWRHLIVFGHMSLNGFSVLLRSHSVRGHLIGHTREEAASESSEPRWQQIADYIKTHREANADGIERYCILDDCSDAFGGRPGVRTDGSTGLTAADADLAIEILNTDGSLKKTADLD